ncbi:MAG: SCP2 sterol-binding domain-containing protein [Chloroflexota bacterium]|nr:MAG: SCP2 sterol-binding domain-containing protein [Chloroflexota bacterium]
MPQFLTEDWIQSFQEKLNSDNQYAEIAKNWEGDVLLIVNPGGPVEERISIYLDLWHGSCREAFYVLDGFDKEPAFSLNGEYEDYLRILKGKLHPMQAMLTRKLSVRGNMGLLMRNVPTVLDFVRCAQEITEVPD